MCHSPYVTSEVLPFGPSLESFDPFAVEAVLTTSLPLSAG